MAYKSKTTIFGLPLIHISASEPAIGFIAIGQTAYGFFSIGQFGVGLVFGIGQFMAGLVTIGQFSIGPIMSIGMFSAGWFSIGMFSAGYEGLHLIGYHFIENNFLERFVPDWEGLVFSLVYLIIFCLFVFLSNLIVNMAVGGITSGIEQIMLKMNTDEKGASTGHETLKGDNGSEKKPFPVQKTARICFFILSLPLVWFGLHQLRIDKAFDRTTVNRVLKTGRDGVGEVVRATDMSVSINDSQAWLVEVLVTPDDVEREPYMAETIVFEDEGGSVSVGEKFSLKYDPKKPEDIAAVP
ncbi:MAG: hypothetical protein EHM28_09990 [Spirochaetaceae bacterium]|nr:MAG: hypothetical protein EHM28_09990 [Spirochaetaceae bacterium]